MWMPLLFLFVFSFAVRMSVDFVYSRIPDDRVQPEYPDEDEQERGGGQFCCSRAEDVFHQQTVSDAVKKGACDAEESDGDGRAPHADQIAPRRNVPAPPTNEAVPKLRPVEPQMKPRKDQQPIGGGDVRLMGDDALLPRKAEQAGKQAVRDGKAADESHEKRSRQPEVDEHRKRPPDIP